ncbi:MAG: alanine--glyoxylate aminotransferase family protein [Thaumarchaeota archaeon]|nr:alanine--glyoxylate aminotransferase family protein [Nitrososphaerota archaeon]
MTPGPTNVPERVMRAMLTPIINHRCEEFSSLFRRIVEKSRNVFETSGNIAVFTASGTGGVEAAVRSVVRNNDNVVVPVFGEFGERLIETITVAGGKAIRVNAPYGSAPNPDDIEEVFEKTGKVKALCMVSNETSTGVRYKWLKEVGEVVSKFGGFFVVDAVTSLGGDEVPVDRLGIDVCSTATHKCLAAPPGLALVSVNERAKKYALENPSSTMYFDLAKQFKFAERGETPYTPSLPLFYALDEALSMVLEEGMPARIKRHRTCAEAFYDAFEALDMEGFAQRDVRSNTVVAFKYSSGVDDSRFRRTLEEQFQVHIAGGFGEYKGKLFRVGCMGEVATYHVLTTVAAVASALMLQKIRCDPALAMSVAEQRLRRLNQRSL